MWDDIQIGCSTAYEIADALIKNEVSLSQLNSVTSFAAKAAVTEDAVWSICKRDSCLGRYLELYPNGRHAAEVEELLWQQAVVGKDLNLVVVYLNKYPGGVHVCEADDLVWELVRINGAYADYLRHFPQGKHVLEARDQQAISQKEEDDWRVAKGFDTPESYQIYLSSYPDGIHKEEASRRIIELMSGRKQSIINALSSDRNAFKLSFIKTMGITADDLKGKIKDSCGRVRDDVLLSWDKKPKDLDMGKTPTNIPVGSTEVYFWGVPGSGKTCAMAAILSQAIRMGCFAPRRGAGLGYMNGLSSVFVAEPDKPAVCLPPASDVDTTQYLPLTLNEVIPGKKGRDIIKQHNLSVIEISGEIFECFSDEVEGKPFKSDQHKVTYEQLKSYLNGRENPKYHFFILDSKPMKDSEQMRYLQNAALFFKDEGIFNSTTQGISLIVTKSDVLSSDRDMWADCAVDAASKYFSSLVNQLKVIVGDPKEGGLGISDGSLNVIPLSIGEVFFQSLCLFDPAPATVLVRLLLEYSKVAESNDWKKKAKTALKR